MKKISSFLKKVFSLLADCIVPTMPIMIGVGMIKVILIVIGPSVLNLLSETSSTYVVLQFVGDAGYYFLPIYVAISSAEVFKTNKFVAGIVGGMLISPAFVEIVNSGEALSFLNIPIALTNYGNQVLPSVIAIWIMSYIYNFLDKHIIENLRSLLVPLFTIILMIPISFSVIGPLGVFLGDELVSLIMLLKNLGPLGNGILCALIPYITIFGLGGANLSAMLLLASSGIDPILFFSNVIYNNVLGFVTLALYIRNKKSDTLAAAITSSVAGTSEPAIFGIVMKDTKALLSLTIGDFVGGLLSGLFGVKAYAMASFGIFGIVTTIGPDSSILYAAISIVAGCAIGFVLSFLTHKSTHE